MADAAKPYVGPYAFEEKDAPLFFGRDEEARKLLDAVISERVVLLYSASGAGKTSLINARLIPELRGQSFDVLPVARVGGSPGAGIAPANVFVYSALRTLACPKTDLSTLVDCTLDAFLRLRPRTAAEVDFLGRVLILDQFEEILTTHPELWEDRRGFFLQLRQALLDDSALTVVLSLREDHLAGLDPFANLLPGQVRTRRLEPLLRRQALDAIRKPAEQAGRPFEPGVAERLVDNLSQVHIAGQEATVAGEIVEPVQLQVVCYQLWENLNGRPGQSISEQDRLDFGDVDQALERFYNSAMERAARESGISTGRIRRWCGAALITPTRIRSQVSREAETSGGLPNAVVDRLLDFHLIRAEATRGGIWYELAHDRFIDPVLRSNEIAQPPEAARLPAAARAWKDSGRDPSYLFRGQRLKNASGLAEDSQSALSKLEMEFLAESRMEEALAKAQARETSRLKVLARVLVVLLLVVVAVAVLTFTVLRLGRKSKSQDLAARAISQAETYPRKGLQLALKSVEMAEIPAAENALHRNLDASDGQPLPSQTLEIGYPGVFAFNHDSSRFVTLARNEKLEVRSSASGALLWKVAEQTPGVTSAVFFGDDLVTGDREGRVSLWSRQGRRKHTCATGSTVNDLSFSARTSLLAVATDNPEVTLLSLPSCQKEKTLTGHSDAVRSVAFNTDGRFLASAGEDGKVLLWNLESGQLVKTYQGLTPAVSLAFGPGDSLATAWDDPDHTVRLGIEEKGKTLSEHEDLVSSVAFSPDGRYLATGSFDKSLTMWNINSSSEFRTLEPGCGPIHRVAFGLRSDGKTVQAITCGDLSTNRGKVILWSNLLEEDIPTLVAEGSLLSVDFTPDGRLVTTTSEGAASIWDQRGRLLGSYTSDLSFRQAQLSRDGKLLAIAVNDGPVLLWDLSMKRQPLKLDYTAERVAFSPNGSVLACAGTDGVLRFWDLQGAKAWHDLPLHYVIRDLAFSPKGKFLAISREGGKVELRSLSGDSRHPPLSLLDKLPSEGRALSFSPDETRLAIGADDGRISIWNLTTMARVSLEGHTKAVTKLAFSRDGRRLASIGSSDDSSVRIWDSETGEEIFSFQGHLASDLAFSPDQGQWLATAGMDGTVRLEPMRLADLKRLARKRLGITPR